MLFILNIVVTSLEDKHYNDVITGAMGLKSPASRVFTQPFVQAQTKENIKAPRHLHLYGEFTGDFPAHRASNAENISIL